MISEAADDLSAPPVGPRPFVADPMIRALPYRALTWEDFEKLLVRVAQDVDGLQHVRRHGKRGQKQDGIDVVGFRPDGQAEAISAKNLETFDENDLKKVIDEFESGGRPVIRLVLFSGWRSRRIANKFRQRFAPHKIALESRSNSTTPCGSMNCSVDSLGL